MKQLSFDLGRLSRRGALAMVGAGGTALALSACGQGRGPTPRSSGMPIVLDDYGFTYSGPDQHRNGGLAGDGRSFFVKRNAKQFTVVDTNGVATQSNLGILGAINTSGAVLGVDGKLYSPPKDSNFAVVIDPETNTATATDFGLNLTGLDKWTDGVIGDDGKIYCAPCLATDILTIDTNTTPATATRSNMGATFAPASALGEDMNWVDGVKSRDGRIFFVPYSATTVLIVDPVKGTASKEDFGLSFGGPGTRNWSGAALGPDGRIYCSPRYAKSVLIIDPQTNTAIMSTFGHDLAGNNKYARAYRLNDNKIYFPPSTRTDIFVIDTTAQMAERIEVPDLDSETAPYYIGGVVDSLGILRCPPRSTSKFLIVGNEPLRPLSLDKAKLRETAAATVSVRMAIPGSTVEVVGNLPAGMSFDAESRTISGTPTRAGLSNFTLRETLTGRPNSPRDSVVSLSIGA